MNQKDSQNTRAESGLAVSLIILSTVLTYGILIPRLGFYRDDWYMLWSGQSQDGLSAIIRLFQTDRPLIGWTYALIFKLIGANVLMWQLLALLLKIFSGLSVLWLVRMVWPEKRLETTAAALLFVLYPGFYQQPVAATFSIDLLGLNAIFISITLTIYAIKTPNRLLRALATLASIILGLINLGLYEATIGLEVVRWSLVWVVLFQHKSPQNAQPSQKTTNGQEQGSRGLLQAWLQWAAKTGLIDSIRRALIFLSPYLLMLAGYLYWRLFIFKSVRRATNIDVILSDYASSPFYSFVQIIIGYIKDLFETVVLAWFVPFYQFTAEGRFNTFISALGIALVVVCLAGIYLFWFRRQFLDEDPASLDSRIFIWIGLIAVVIPSAVIVLLGRNVLFSIQWDRYTTQSMLGVAILLSGLLFKYLRGSARWSILAAMIVLAVVTHYHSAANYSRFWDYERSIIWQLSWRVPGLQPGTTLIVSLPEGARLAEEYEIWGPVNMAYFSGQAMQVSGQVPTDTLILDLQAGTREKRLMRNLNIVRDFSRPLIISLPSGSSCVHILDGKNLALPFFEDGRIKEIAPYSDISLIDLSSAPMTPSTSIFGPQPDQNWCFYYQKIELALQSGNFVEAARMADEANRMNLKPSDATEWVTVVEAYFSSGQIDKAATTTKEIDKDLRKYICLQQSMFTRPAISTGQEKEASVPNTAPNYSIKNSLCGGN